MIDHRSLTNSDPTAPSRPAALNHKDTEAQRERVSTAIPMRCGIEDVARFARKILPL
jgi:hypothetical protein